MSLGKNVETLKNMNNNKAADSSGIMAELFKAGGNPLWDALLDLFNDILIGTGMPPQTRRQTGLRVLFKKGDQQALENYRPISILPILLKLFSRVIHARINSNLDAAQSVDQAGFRSGFACDDHLFSVTMLAEKAKEWNTPLWIVAIDFKKAFDTAVSYTHLTLPTKA